MTSLTEFVKCMASSLHLEKSRREFEVVLQALTAHKTVPTDVDKALNALMKSASEQDASPMLATFEGLEAGW